MLQTINAETRGRQASSLYCVWIKSAPEEDAPLVAIWIDREMRAFTHECGAGVDRQVIPQDSARNESELPPVTSEFQPTTDEEQ